MFCKDVKFFLSLKFIEFVQVLSLVVSLLVEHATFDLSALTFILPL